MAREPLQRAIVRWTLFSPAELAVLSGLNAEMQRVWRRRDQLPGTGNPTRFTSLEAAEVLVRHRLSLFGVTPGQSQEIGQRAAPLAVYFSLLDADGACEVLGQKDDVDRILDDHDNGDRLARWITGVEEINRFLWRADDGDLDLVADIQDITLPGEHITAFFIDLMAAGSRLGETAGRPLVTVQLELPAGSRPYRRLTGRRSSED